ncbi:unnamed protein product, partial [Discosporangium mesarthrocarpum]
APTHDRPRRRRANPEPTRATEVMAKERDGGGKWPKCWHCRQQGHMAHDCPNRVCTVCGETGHGPSRCKRQEMIPAGYTATVVEPELSGKYTVLAATETRADGFDEWIADSGATWHMTNKAT